MIRFLLTAILVCYAMLPVQAQKSHIFNGDFYNKENNIVLHLNLTEEKINIPGLELLGPTNGYMNGSIYGTWIVTKFKESEKNVTIRFSNDFGSETQEVKFTHMQADTFSLEMLSPQGIRKVDKRKLIKIPSKYIFVKTSR